MPTISMYNSCLGGISAKAKWGASATTPASRLFRCKHNSPRCTNSSSKCVNLLYCRGVSVHLQEKERGQCALATGVFVAQKKQGVAKRPSRGCSGRRALNNNEVSGTEGGGIRGRFRSHLQEDAGGDGDNTSNCLYLKKTICNGEVVEHTGSVIILGDVKPGGHVLADGDVVVLGRLQGHVHAGRAGECKSRVFATAMEPREIRICDSALFCPEDDGLGSPKMAVFLPDGNVTIHPAVEELAEKLIVPPHIRSGHKHVGIGNQVPEQASQRDQSHQSGGLRNQRPAQVALVTGVYISIAGIALLGYPKVLFGILFDLQGVTLGWVQVGAILALGGVGTLYLVDALALVCTSPSESFVQPGKVVFGVYYIGTAIGDMRGVNGADAFYLSTVVGRMFLFLSFSWLVVTGAVPSPLFLVGAVNLVGAMVMLKALLKKPPVRSLG